MSYATQQDLIDRFGSTDLIQLTDHDNTDAIDATVLERALADASAEIDGYIASNYALPLSTVPAILTRLACDMARYFLMGDRVTDAVAHRYNNAVTFLRSVANGKASLGLDAAATPAAQTGGAIYVAADRVFTRDTLSDY